MPVSILLGLRLEQHRLLVVLGALGNVNLSEAIPEVDVLENFVHVAHVAIADLSEDILVGNLFPGGVSWGLLGQQHVKGGGGLFDGGGGGVLGEDLVNVVGVVVELVVGVGRPLGKSFADEVLTVDIVLLLGQSLHEF